MVRPRWVVLPLLLHCLLHSPIVCAQDGQDNDPSTLFKRASDMMNLRKYDGALGLLNAVLEVDPNHSESYRQRASVLRHKCRYKEAESDYNKYLELKPGTASMEKELSQLLQAQNALESAYGQFYSGDFSKVLEYVNKIVLVFSPGCLKGKLLKAKALLALKDYSSVISESGFILKEDEDNLDALLLRGRAYYYLADHDVASRHYQKGLRLDPEHLELKKAYFGLKNLLKKTKSAEDNAAKGKLRVAAEDYKAALAMDPDHTSYNIHLYLGLCKTLVKLGRGKEAISSCTKALNIDGELVDALTQRGEAKFLAEDWEGAVQDLKEAAQKSPQGELESLLDAQPELAQNSKGGVAWEGDALHQVLGEEKAGQVHSMGLLPVPKQVYGRRTHHFKDINIVSLDGSSSDVETHMLEEIRQLKEHSRMQDKVIEELKNNQRHHENQEATMGNCARSDHNNSQNQAVHFKRKRVHCLAPNQNDGFLKHRDELNKETCESEFSDDDNLLLSTTSRTIKKQKGQHGGPGETTTIAHQEVAHDKATCYKRQTPKQLPLMKAGSMVLLMTSKYPNKAHVAYATLLSTDPEATVGGVKTGSQFYKVRINHVIAKDEPLVRPMPRCNNIGDAQAKGVSIAWPSMFVELING